MQDHESPEPPNPTTVDRRFDPISASGLFAWLVLVPTIAWATLDRHFRSPPTPIDDYQFRLDIANAPQREIRLLPRIGPKLSQRIVDYRDEYGPFQHPEDLKRVRGIGDKMLESFKDYLYVANDNPVDSSAVDSNHVDSSVPGTVIDN